MKQTISQSSDQIATGSDNDRNLAVIAHAGGIFFGFIPALIIWLMKKDDKKALFVINQAKEALNFQITISLAFFICFLLIFVLIGALLIWLVWLFDIIYCILAAVKVSRGENYHYPFTFRLIK